MKLALALMLFPICADANPLCGPHDQIAEYLARYDEARRSVAINQAGMAVEMWANADTGSWTITVTPPGGLTCLATWGNAWTEIAMQPKGIDG